MLGLPLTFAAPLVAHRARRAAGDLAAAAHHAAAAAPDRLPAAAASCSTCCRSARRRRARPGGCCCCALAIAALLILAAAGPVWNPVAGGRPQRPAPASSSTTASPAAHDWRERVALRRRADRGGGPRRAASSRFVATADTPADIAAADPGRGARAAARLRSRSRISPDRRAHLACDRALPRRDARRRAWSGSATASPASTARPSSKAWRA